MSERDFYRYLFSQLKSMNYRVIDCDKDYGREYKDYYVITKQEMYTIYKFTFDHDNNFIRPLINGSLIGTYYSDIRTCVEYHERDIKKLSNGLIEVNVAKVINHINFFVNYIDNNFTNMITLFKNTKK